LLLLVNIAGCYYNANYLFFYGAFMEEDKKEVLSNLNPTAIRMPTALKDRLRAAAKNNDRSLNYEIVARLEASLTVGNDFEGLSPEQAQAVKLIISQFKQVNPAQ